METLNQRVELETAMIALGLENAEYEPEQFPGLIYQYLTKHPRLAVSAA
jgi:TATA-box binding protein (TBP) (component of TFIID and TFIIIB)